MEVYLVKPVIFSVSGGESAAIQDVQVPPRTLNTNRL